MKLVVDKESVVSVQEQVVAQLTVLIRSGKLESGVRLPTVKELANSLNLNYNTVAAAYRELERRGYLEQNRGGGTRVTATLPQDPETDLLAHVTAEAARQLSALPGDANTALHLLAANLALGSLKSPLTVAVLARTPLEAARAAERTWSILGDGYTCVPQTPAEFRSADYHLTVVDPGLVGQWAQPLSAASPPYVEPHSATFPAGAD